VNTVYRRKKNSAHLKHGLTRSVVALVLILERSVVLPQVNHVSSLVGFGHLMVYLHQTCFSVVNPRLVVANVIKLAYFGWLEGSLKMNCSHWIHPTSGNHRVFPSMQTENPHRRIPPIRGDDTLEVI
jgi:hypothetical protein